MKIKEYAAKCRTFVTSKNADAMDKYFQLGFIEEVGELSGKFAKFIRNNDTDVLDIISAEYRKEIAKEIGDVCWFAVMNCKEFRAGDELLKGIAEDLDKMMSGVFNTFKVTPIWYEVVQQQVGILSATGGKLFFYY